MAFAGYKFFYVTEDRKVHPIELNHNQHMSWFCVLFVHSFIDLLMRLRVSLPKGLDYLSGGVAWGFVGMSFIIHANMVSIIVCMMAMLHVNAFASLKSSHHVSLRKYEERYLSEVLCNAAP